MASTSHTEHSITVSASADDVYAVLADVSRWPVCFTPTIHAERTAGDDAHERIRIWALANGEPRSWTSRRDLDRAARRIVFRQDAAKPPIHSMEGGWLVSALSADESHVLLTHDFELLTGDSADMAWVSAAVETNSDAELRSLKRTAENGGGLFLDFTDTLEMAGSPAAAYAFIYRADEWPTRLPHVTRVDLAEKEPGVQVMSMDTVSPDGSAHITESVRICFDGERIVYKQTRLPPVMTAHTGEWRFAATRGGVAVTSRHTVVIDAAAARKVLGADASAETIREQVRKTLGGNSMTTLRQAGVHIEKVSA